MSEAECGRGAPDVRIFVEARGKPDAVGKFKPENLYGFLRFDEVEVFHRHSQRGNCGDNLHGFECHIVGKFGILRKQNRPHDFFVKNVHSKKKYDYVLVRLKIFASNIGGKKNAPTPRAYILDLPRPRGI